MTWTGARLLLECIKQEGASTLFGYPGGAALPIYDALVDVTGLRHILVRHEQGAVHAADGWARASGKPGVVVATSGPGATNLMTGLATAYADSVPLVALTGQVPSALMGTDAFQESDVLGASLPFTKFSALVRSPEDIPRLVREAFRHATTARPGPVLLDVPKDVSARATDVRPEPPEQDPAPTMCASQSAVDEAASLLTQASKPMLYVGGGVVRSGCAPLVRRLAHEAGIPVTTTLMALGVMDSADPLFLGMPGMHGTRRANAALAECDVLLAVGARFDDRVTGNAKRFSPKSKRIVVDADPAEFGKICRADLRLHGDAALVLAALNERLPAMHRGSYEPWRKQLAGQPGRPPVSGVPPQARLRPEQIFNALNDLLPQHAFVTTDVGQHQMWAAQLIHHRRAGAFITSGGLGTMGFGLPAALGAKLACPESPVVAVVGDGGFQMTNQELSTMARYSVGVVVVVIDNQCLGMVRQWQQLFHERRYSEIDLSDNPDFVALARAMNVEAATAGNGKELTRELSGALSRDRPSLIHVPIYRGQNVFPIVPPGQPATIMLDHEGDQE